MQIKETYLNNELLDLVEIYPIDTEYNTMEED